MPQGASLVTAQTSTESANPTNEQLTTEEPMSFRGFNRLAAILMIAAGCLAGAVWGVYTENWVLVAAEVPSVVGLLLVAALAATTTSRSVLVRAASIVGLLCLVEMAIATWVVEISGTRLAGVVALSSGLTTAVGVAWWLRARKEAGHES